MLVCALFEPPLNVVLRTEVGVRGVQAKALHMWYIPPSAGFRFPFLRKLSWRPTRSFQFPPHSLHPCLNISVISRYGTQGVEVFIASRGYQERLAVLSSVLAHKPILITSFPSPCKSKSTSSKIAAALKPNMLPGVFFPPASTANRMSFLLPMTAQRLTLLIHDTITRNFH